jgi:PBSX family phage terminase large subunit
MTQYAPFCNKSVNYLRKCYNNWLNVAEGGKRAGKNVLNILAWCDILETHPDKLHLAAGVSNSTSKLNIIDSNGYGLLSYFKGRCRQGKYQEKDALIVQTQTGEKVILIAGGGREGDEKLIKGWTLGSAYITEVNECCKTFVKEVFDRTLSSSNRKIFFDLNPKSPNHWFYEEILNFHTENNYKFDNYGLNYEHFTLHDNFSFDNDKIRDIIRTYAKGTVWYNRDILGKRTNAEGIIYDMFNDDNTYEDGQSNLDFDRWMNVYYGIDYGTSNPFVILKMIEQDGFYYIDDEYYYDSKKHNRQKDDTEYAEDTLEFINNTKYIQVVVDPSATSFKVSARKKGIRVRDAINDVIPGIRLVASLFHTNKLKINKTKCPNLIKEFSSYIWDEKASEKGNEKPVKDSDHCCDSLRYLAFTIIKRV